MTDISVLHRAWWRVNDTGAVSLAVAVVGTIAVAIAGVAAIVATNNPHLYVGSASAPGSVQWHQHHPVRTAPLPVAPLDYLGAFERSSNEGSYAGMEHFAKVTNTQPDIALYYSGWSEPFKTGFADNALAKGAIPAVQIDPGLASIAGIAAGEYDPYLRSYADQVANYGHPVIIGFGHEMNGSWFSWGYQHTSPAVFVAAWRQIVNVFRQQGADNVTWLWTINIIDTLHGLIPAPAPWWPGRSYVTWVGIDGYYYKPSWKFAPLFGPTINAVHKLSREPIPILIAETGAAPAAGKPAKIVNLFGGIRAYGLLGLVWFDAIHDEDWRLNNPAAIATFHREAEMYKDPTS